MTSLVIQEAHAKLLAGAEFSTDELVFLNLSKSFVDQLVDAFGITEEIPVVSVAGDNSYFAQWGNASTRNCLLLSSNHRGHIDVFGRLNCTKITFIGYFHEFLKQLVDDEPLVVLLRKCSTTNQKRTRNKALS